MREFLQFVEINAVSNLADAECGSLIEKLSTLKIIHGE
jgi:hypothetical protein